MMRASKRVLKAGDVADALDKIAPPHLAQSWDNVGLLVGDRQATARHILLCIDFTPAVLEEAIRESCDFVVAYHPPLFRPIHRILAQSSETDGLIHRAIGAGLAIYSPHTALDAAAGGTNDVMADLCRLKDVEPFEYVVKSGPQCKVVTFVPESALEKVAQAMWSAGAGQIGDYEQCSYRLHGEGTFFGSQETHPQVGRRGRLERVSETRIEVLTSSAALPRVIDALRRSHPYEEPAFDIYPLANEPLAGIGRVGALPAGMTLLRLGQLLKRATRSRVVTLIGSEKTKLSRAAVCVGAAGRLPFENARAAECDVVVTGEIRHHDALALLRRRKTAIALGHWESERPVLPRLAKTLAAALPGLAIKLSRRDVSPLSRL